MQKVIGWAFIASGLLMWLIGITDTEPQPATVMGGVIVLVLGLAILPRNPYYTDYH